MSDDQLVMFEYEEELQVEVTGRDQRGVVSREKLRLRLPGPDWHSFSKLKFVEVEPVEEKVEQGKIVIPKPGNIMEELRKIRKRR